MPDVSIAISAQDSYSSAIKSMAHEHVYFMDITEDIISKVTIAPTIIATSSILPEKSPK